MPKNNYSTKQDIKRLEEKFEELKSDVLNMKLEILGELKNMREEHDTHQYSHQRINDEIQDHEKRQKVLET